MQILLNLSKAQRDAFLELAEQELKRRKLELYKPYTKQRVFHSHGKTYRERLFRAGNQLGKSYSGAAEAAMHATGLYPEWWEGRIIEKANSGWAGGVTGEVTRDTIQRLLIGAVGARGTGLIPEKYIDDVIPARGIAGLADTIVVHNIKGGKSRIRLKYFEQGREKWQADTVDWVWFDEEPPEDIYSEGLTRTNATGGFTWLTFTPLLGMSNVVRRFLMETSPDRADINMTIDDAEHYTPEQRAQIIASYPPHEREARTKGIPIMGSGLIFPVPDDDIAVDAFPIPAHWRQIGGLDFGWDHPTAGVRLAHDADNDVVYIIACYKKREATPLIHAGALKAWGDWLPWAWPHDGLQHDKGSGEQLAEQYRKHGMQLTFDKATFEDGTNGVEAGLSDMLDRMQTGRFKVFRHLTEWFEEKHLYHRKDGKVVKEFDDAISAARYALMMIRFARTSPKKSDPNKKKSQGSWMTA